MKSGVLCYVKNDNAVSLNLLARSIFVCKGHRKILVWLKHFTNGKKCNFRMLADVVCL